LHLTKTQTKYQSEGIL